MGSVLFLSLIISVLYVIFLWPALTKGVGGFVYISMSYIIPYMIEK